jgi:hypothetical protein
LGCGHGNEAQKAFVACEHEAEADPVVSRERYFRWLTAAICRQYRHSDAAIFVRHAGIFRYDLDGNVEIS